MQKKGANISLKTQAYDNTDPEKVPAPVPLNED